MRPLFLISLLSLMLFSCTTTSKNEKIKASELLLGEWVNQSKEGIVSENWSQPNDSTLVAGSFFIKEKDTLHFENSVLKEKEGELVYFLCFQKRKTNWFLKTLQTIILKKSNTYATPSLQLPFPFLENKPLK